MKRPVILLTCLITALTLQSYGGEDVPSSPQAICPVLMSESLPELGLKDAAGQAFDMLAALSKKPAVLIFYRGGWCPYCNSHLQEIQKVEQAVLDLGYQILAVSPDRPERLAQSSNMHGLKYTLLSDSHMTASRALGIAFQVDDDTVALYKSKYGIDIEADSGQTHHQLPVPSVFIVGQDGIVQFAYVNPDYKVRMSGALLLEAAKSLQ